MGKVPFRLVLKRGECALILNVISTSIRFASRQISGSRISFFRSHRVFRSRTAFFRGDGEFTFAAPKSGRSSAIILSLKPLRVSWRTIHFEEFVNPFRPQKVHMQEVRAELIIPHMNSQQYELPTLKVTPPSVASFQPTRIDAAINQPFFSFNLPSAPTS
jgi:hypothetical protein